MGDRDLDRLPLLGAAGVLAESIQAVIVASICAASSGAYLGHEIGARVAWRRWRAAAEIRTEQARVKRAVREVTASAPLVPPPPLCTCAPEQISAVRRRVCRFAAAVELQTALRAGEYGDPWTSKDVDPGDVQRLRESAILAGIRGVA